MAAPTSTVAIDLSGKENIDPDHTTPSNSDPPNKKQRTIARQLELSAGSNTLVLKEATPAPAEGKKPTTKRSKSVSSAPKNRSPPLLHQSHLNLSQVSSRLHRRLISRAYDRGSRRPRLGLSLLPHFYGVQERNVFEALVSQIQELNVETSPKMAMTIDPALFVHPSGSLQSRVLALLHYPTFTTQQPRWNETADLTNGCLKFCAGYLNGGRTPSSMTLSRTACSARIHMIRSKAKVAVIFGAENFKRYRRMNLDKIELTLFDDAPILEQSTHCFLEVTREPRLIISRIVFLEYHPEYFRRGPGKASRPRQECALIRQHLLLAIAFPGQDCSAVSISRSVGAVAEVRRRLRLPVCDRFAVVDPLFEGVRDYVARASSLSARSVRKLTPAFRLFKTLLEIIRQEDRHQIFLTSDEVLHEVPELKSYIGTPLHLPTQWINSDELDVYHPVPFFIRAFPTVDARQQSRELQGIPDSVQQALRHPSFRSYRSLLWPAIDQMRRRHPELAPAEVINACSGDWYPGVWKLSPDPDVVMGNLGLSRFYLHQAHFYRWTNRADS